MTKTRSTKSALISSVLALVLCFTMLLGTTFAWFTDSVTSANNIIKSGTLNVEMYWAEGTEDPASVAWNDASTGAIFNYDKWEPGYVEVRHIKIANEGTLALKYKLSIIANGEVSDLSDVIDVYYVDPAVQVSDRAQLTDANKLGTLTEVLANLANTANGELEASENDTITLALKMREDAGNEYQGKSIGASFSVQLLATQLTSEDDSFGNDYDANAEYVVEVATVDALKAALANVQDGDVIKLAADMTVTAADATVTNGYIDGLVYVGDESFTIDLNGYTLTDDGSLNDYLIYLKNNGEKANKITIKNGSVTVVSQAWSAIAVNNASYNQTSVLNLDNVIVTVSNTQNWSNDAIRARHGATINLNEGTVINSVGTAYGVTANYTGVLNINSGAKVIQTNSGTSGGNYPYSAVSGTGTVNIYEGAVIESDCYGIHNMTTLNPVINIYGGTITAPYALHASTNGATGQSATINVYNGTIDGELSTYSDNGHIVVKGGTFTVDPSAYVPAKGYVVTDNGNSTWTVSMKEHTVSSANELATAIAEGGKVTLTQNIEVTSTLNVVADTVIDLNGNTVTNNNGAVITINGGTLVLNDNGTDGAIVAGSTSTNNDDKAAILFGANGGKFVMESGTLKSTKYAVRSYSTPSEIVINGGTMEAEYYGVYDNSGSVTMNGGTIIANTANVSYGIAAYGSFIMNGGKITAACAYCSQGTYDDTVAVINGGELIGTVYNGIYWPSAGSLTINGGSITGVNGVHVRSGSLSITGGTITGTGENDTALTVENIGGNSGYQAITSVSVTGGTFASVSGSAVTSVPDTTGSNPNAVAVTGFITGGTYSSDVSDLVAEGYTATENNGVWTVAAN